MNDFTGIGSAEAGNPDGGNGGEQAGAGAQSDNQDAGRQDAGNLDWLKAKGWSNDDGSVKTEEIVKGYQELEKKTGSLVGIPGEKSTPEEVDAFHKKLGWPGEAKGYEFKKPEGLDPNMPYDEGFAEMAKEWANEARLSISQAQTLHDKIVEKSAADAAAFWASRDKAAKDAQPAFVEKWGAVGSEGYNQKVDAASRALRNDPALAGLEAELKQAGILTPGGGFTSFAIGHLLAQHGASLQNDSFVGNGSGGPAGENPFDRSSKAWSISVQAQTIREAPDRARALAHQAGWSKEAIDKIGKSEG